MPPWLVPSPSPDTAGHFLPTFCPVRYIAVSANMFLKSSSFHRKYRLPLLSPGISAPSILLKYQYVFLFLPHHMAISFETFLSYLIMFFDIVSVICSSHSKKKSNLSLRTCTPASSSHSCDGLFGWPIIYLA